jgi:hypothetical protein
MLMMVLCLPTETFTASTENHIQHHDQTLCLCYLEHAKYMHKWERQRRPIRKVVEKGYIRTKKDKK